MHLLSINVMVEGTEKRRGSEIKLNVEEKEENLQKPIRIGAFIVV